MIMRIMGTIVDGSLRLDEKLDWPDQVRVNVTLEPLRNEDSVRREDFERLTDSFAKYRLDVGPRTWDRESLHER
jgi:hypothetical protein